MDRRHFLGSTLGTIGAWAAAGLAAEGEPRPPRPVGTEDASLDPSAVKLRIKPVLTSIIHTGVWEGPCRWQPVSVEQEAVNARASFANWAKALKERGLGPAPGVEILEPVHVTFSEDFTIKPDQWAKLDPDGASADAFYVIPVGSSVSAFEIGDRFKRPILMTGLGCRNVDIASYARAQGNEAWVAADDADLLALLGLLRARKVLWTTRVLFPTDRGLPASCATSSLKDLGAMEKRLGVKAVVIPYKELAEEMERVKSDAAATAELDQAADGLVRGARRSFIEKGYVTCSLQFHRTVRNLLARHGANAFTIECFEFCSSRLPDRWKITPCLIHSLLRDRGHASSCEGDLGSLLGMRLLMSVAGKSCHQGNSDPRELGTFRINHSVPALKMDGYDRPDRPYQLGRFTSSGWGTKMVVNFMDHAEKTVTVARIDPTATRLLVLRGELVGASGWDEDLIGCSVEAVIRPPAGRCDEFLRMRLDYGNHLQWVYGDYVEPLRRLGEMAGLQVEVIA